MTNSPNFGWSYPPGVTGNEPEIAGYPDNDNDSDCDHEYDSFGECRLCDDDSQICCDAGAQGHGGPHWKEE